MILGLTGDWPYKFYLVSQSYCVWGGEFGVINHWTWYTDEQAIQKLGYKNP